MFLAIIVGILAGLASAFFLAALELMESFREEQSWLIYLLPLAGLLIVLLYKKFGDGIEKESNLVFDEIKNPQKTIPLKLAPLVLFGTLITHLFGGSAGREGTAVQMSTSISDQFTRLFKLNADERKMILICGISAGFASVFGTPLTAAFFAIEVLVVGQFYTKAFIPSLISAFVANWVCDNCGIIHTGYFIADIPKFSLINLLYVVIASCCFALVGFVYPYLKVKSTAILSKLIPNDFYKIVIGALIIVLFYLISGSTQYLGLGVPYIVESFTHPQEIYVFLIKLILTVITLSVGFKGGEVTPLFFIGASLGSALSIFLNLPVDLLAGMGFVAVFAACTNAPLACAIMGMELFGIDSAIYMLLACYIAYFLSGQNSIYSSQIKGNKITWV